MNVMNVRIPDQEKVLKAYDHDIQSLVHVEELGELTQAVSKMRRLIHNLDRPFDPTGSEKEAEAYGNLVEEMADSLIVIEQIKEMYSVTGQELQDMVDMKCARQERRLSKLSIVGEGGQAGTAHQETRREAVHDVNV